MEGDKIEKDRLRKFIKNWNVSGEKNTYFCNVVVINIFCQYCQYSYTIRILEYMYFTSHLSIFWFPFTFHLWRGHPLPVPPPLGTSCLEQQLHNFFNFVVKNVFCQSIFIYNIALQNTDFYVLQKSSKRFLFYFHLERGGHPPSLSHPDPHFMPRTRALPLFIAIHAPPPPPFHQILECRVTIWLLDRIPE